jgi:hypothetical protein
MIEAIWFSETLATSQILHGLSTQKQVQHQYDTFVEVYMPVLIIQVSGTI